MSGDLVKFLEGASRYFESRPDGGEDKAHWANIYNAENCRKAAAELTRLRSENAELVEQSRRTGEIALSLLQQINPHDLPEGTAQIYFSLRDQIKVHGPAALSRVSGGGK